MWGRARLIRNIDKPKKRIMVMVISNFVKKNAVRMNYKILN